MQPGATSGDRWRSRLGLVALATTALIAGGCGDDGTDDAAPAPQAPTEAHAPSAEAEELGGNEDRDPRETNGSEKPGGEEGRDRRNPRREDGDKPQRENADKPVGELQAELAEAIAEGGAGAHQSPEAERIRERIERLRQRQPARPDRDGRHGPREDRRDERRGPPRGSAGPGERSRG